MGHPTHSGGEKEREREIKKTNFLKAMEYTVQNTKLTRHQWGEWWFYRCIVEELH
jgi:hypothetical protein